MNFLEIDDTLFCLFSGRLDGYVCSEIENDLLCQVNDFKKNRKSVRLTFDLADVVFISSAFLRICLICCKIIDKNGFAITNVSEETYNVFHISGFVEIMNVVRADTALQLA